MREMVIYGVSFDMVGKSPIVLLKTADGNQFLPIWIGHPEAHAILMKLQGQAAPRPMTHDLLTDMLSQLDAQVSRVTVTELRDSTFYALVTVRTDGQEIEIDSRPSDAIAIALRAEAPIFVAERVLEESAIEFEGEESGELHGELSEEEVALVQQWRERLENISPEEFTEGPAEEDDV
jgi:bifunctional DNase/RNase